MANLRGSYGGNNSSSDSLHCSIEPESTRLHDRTQPPPKTSQFQSGRILCFSQAPTPSHGSQQLGQCINSWNELLRNRSWVIKACILVLASAAFILGDTFIKANSRWPNVTQQQSSSSRALSDTRQLDVGPVRAQSSAPIEVAPVASKEQREPAEKLEEESVAMIINWTSVEPVRRLFTEYFLTYYVRVHAC